MRTISTKENWTTLSLFIHKQWRIGIMQVSLIQGGIYLCQTTTQKHVLQLRIPIATLVAVNLEDVVSAHGVPVMMMYFSWSQCLKKLSLNFVLMKKRYMLLDAATEECSHTISLNSCQKFLKVISLKVLNLLLIKWAHHRNLKESIFLQCMEDKTPPSQWKEELTEAMSGYSTQLMKWLQSGQKSKTVTSQFMNVSLHHMTIL